MDFSDIINDLIKLEGIRLNSIRPGAEITIKHVDIAQKKVVVESSTGKLQSRSFSEFQRIWEALLSTTAIRVEEVLNGSGSSRNQPETIFANLPYIQWLKIDNKKHIAYIGAPTHPYGTIQQMDSIQVAQIANKELDDRTGDELIVLVVTDDIVRASKAITTLTGNQGKAAFGGYYTYNYDRLKIVLADTEKLKIPCGTYTELPHAKVLAPQHKVSFLERSWVVISEAGVKAVVRI